MRYWVGCTIDVVSSGISCDIEIGHTRVKNEVWAQTWKKIGGRLDIGENKGDWMYGTNKIALVATASDSDPRWFSPSNWLVFLNDVTDRFAEKLVCGDYFSGDGILNPTRESLIWKMWYPCA